MQKTIVLLCALFASLGMASAQMTTTQSRTDVDVRSGRHIRAHERVEQAEQPRMRHQRGSIESTETQTSQPEPQMRQERSSTTTTTVQRRDGKLFFRDRELFPRRDIDRNDWHFRMGLHDRTYWTTHFSTVVLIDGCYYYEDGGLFYPAYGYDPDCDYPDRFVVFTVSG